MQDYPHHYRAGATGSSAGVVTTTSPGLADLQVQAPPEFDGPGGFWSPETLLVSTVANCFILTFRAVARGARFDWNEIDCEVTGVLERVDRVTQFTGYHLDVTIRLPAGADADKAVRLAEKSVAVCLVTNSLTGGKQLRVTTLVEP